jgi:chromosome segregation ATPase
VEKEDELLQKKGNEEKRVVKLVYDDIKDQIKMGEEHFNIAQATQVKQDAIEKNLKMQFDKA